MRKRPRLILSPTTLQRNTHRPWPTTINPPDRAQASPSDIRPISITDEMKRSYLDYAMSVIVARALPDVRDGLKPVHRRILYSMHENNYTPDRAYNKSARVIGDTMGKYHPHGNQAIYDALVRMAQDFSMRLPLIDGQGNFGSVDGDPPAAERYTEVRLATPGHDAARRSRERHGRLPGELRRARAGADGPAGEVPEPAGQRRRRHRRRHGHQHPAAQSRRGDRRLHRLSRQSGDLHRGADRDRSRPGLPHRRPDPRQGRHPLRLSQGPRLDPDARPRHHRNPAQGARGAGHHRDSLSGEQGDDGREDRRAGAREEDRGHLRHSRRVRAATACAWSSS